MQEFHKNQFIFTGKPQEQGRGEEKAGVKERRWQKVKCPRGNCRGRLALFVSLKSQAEKYCSLICCERKTLYHV